MKYHKRMRPKWSNIHLVQDRLDKKLKNRDKALKDVVKMAAGGASWKNELDSIEETKRALQKHDYWNFDAKKNYFLRKLRTKIKYWLSVIKMEKVITRWRKRKWEN